MTTNQPLAEIMESCWKESITTIRSKIECAIANDEYFVNKVNAGSSSPLYEAARIGRLSVVNLLLELGFDPNRQSNYTGRTALHRSIIYRKYEVAMRLCEVTSDWVHIGPGRRRELTPAEIPKFEELICKMIDSGYDINSVDSSGGNALMNMIHCGYHALIPILVKRGGDVEFKTASGRTCLFAAVGIQQYEACKHLLDSGANVHAVDDCGNTVLMRAAATGNVQIAALLVLSGARVNHQKGVNGGIMTPLSISIRSRCYALARYFIENGANIEINLTDDQTVLGLLCDARTFEAVVELLQQKHKDLVNEHFNEFDDLSYAHSLEEAEGVVKGMKIDESTKIMILTLCREPKVPKQALELLKFVEIFQKQKNLNGLLNSDTVREMQIPMNILQMIASPLKWH